MSGYVKGSSWMLRYIDSRFLSGQAYLSAMVERQLVRYGIQQADESNDNIPTDQLAKE